MASILPTVSSRGASRAKPSAIVAHEGEPTWDVMSAVEEVMGVAAACMNSSDRALSQSTDLFPLCTSDVLGDLSNSTTASTLSSLIASSPLGFFLRFTTFYLITPPPFPFSTTSEFAFFIFQQWLGVLAFLLTLYFTISGLLWLLFYSGTFINKAFLSATDGYISKIQPKKLYTTKKMWEEIRWSLSTILVGSVITTFPVSMYKLGYSTMYWDPYEYSLPYCIIKYVVFDLIVVRYSIAP